MAVLLSIEAALQAHYLEGHNLSGTRAAVAFYFIMAFYFTATLECPSYVYGCEIWPTHLRSKGATVSYFGFYIFSIWTTAPAAQAFETIGWKYYMVFIAVTVAMTIPCMLYLPEVSCFRPCSEIESLLTLFRRLVSPLKNWVPSSVMLSLLILNKPWAKKSRRARHVRQKWNIQRLRSRNLS